MSKYVFFDIDGTLWDLNQQIPSSTVDSLHKLRAKGHRAFINTGRSRANTHDIRLEALQFDGIIAACGNHIEMRDGQDSSVIYEELLEKDAILHAQEVLREYAMPIIYEGPDTEWLNVEDFARDSHGIDLWNQLKGYASRVPDNIADLRINKLTAEYSELTRIPEIVRQLPEFTIIDHPGSAIELIPAGSSKIEGIRHLQELLHISDDDIYALGDGANDMDMIAGVRHGIAMGDGSSALKEVAEYVTSPLHEDGVATALTHYGLI